MDISLVKFSNPRLRAEFSDWPLGGNRRGRCLFEIEHNLKRGWRILRTTTGKPKVATFGGKAAIVDGSDGRTYILQHTGIYAFITIVRSDLMHAASVHASSDPERYAELLAIIKSAYMTKAREVPEGVGEK